MDEELPKKSLDKMKCFYCERYLSYFPIYSSDSLNSVCGRCESSRTRNTFRNKIYEISVETFSFPCCYNLYGCEEKFKPKDIPEHERWCKFKIIHCPAFDIITGAICEWEGLSRHIYEHFAHSHPKYILQDGRFEADLITSHRGQFLYAFGQDYFIITKSTDSVKNVVMCTVTYIGTDRNVNSYYFRITLSTPNGEKSMDMVGKIGATVEMYIPVILDMLGNPTSIIAEIDVFEKTEDDLNVGFVNLSVRNDSPLINYDMLEEIRCLGCSRYMLPPIYQCETGHSICSDCMKKTKECITCQTKISSTQNYALAQLILHMFFPCSYSDCNFISRALDIRKHEASCPYRPTYCPLKESTFCEVRPIFSKIRDHFISDHSGLFLENEVISWYVEEMITLHYLIPYDDKIFILHFNSDILNDTVQWSMQFHTPVVDDIHYQFGIDIKDLSGNNRRFYLRGSCSLLKEQEEEIKYETRVSFDQLQRFLREEKLVYSVRIIEENFS